jgi:GrpB-like predicted nucleotidyltransferase (UPF0157 family)
MLKIGVMKGGIIMLGLERGLVKLEPYNDKWSKLFDKERELLSSQLKDLIIEIEHVGSTSIEGLFAKPVIDIAIGVSSLNVIIELKEKVKALGYMCRRQVDFYIFAYSLFTLLLKIHFFDVSFDNYLHPYE